GPPPGVVRFPGGYELEPLAPVERLDVGDGTPLTLGQVLSSTERHHPTILAARRDLRAARGEHLAAEGAFDPQLAARGWATPAGYYRWARADVSLTQPTPIWGTEVYAGWRIGRPLDADEDVDPGIPTYYRNHETLTGGELRAGVRVPLWRDGPIDERRARLWRAEHGVDAAARDVDATRLSIVYEGADAYWSWVSAGQKYLIAAWLLDLAERRDDQVRARAAAGAIPPVEALENRRALLNRRQQLIRTRRALEQAAISLSLYLRSPDGTPVLPRPDRVPVGPEPPAPLEVTLRDAIRRTIAEHPTLARYDALVERQRVQTEYAESRFAPRIDVRLEGSVDLGGGNERQRTVYEEPTVQGSVLVELPLLFREARGGIQEARGELGALRQEAELARNRVVTDVRDAWSAVRAARQRYQATRQTARVAAALARAEMRRFELGATELFIVNLREQAAAEAAADLAEAIANLHVTHARWRAVTAQTPSAP
ncbi:MAG TPA: TolC family protein, partial [Sandaracinaceae bacterium LLY-WYZ-13_1]|nr:TolC family protein [Sandaracinaceae bacterium LLY-WYZ-13_1]